MFSVLLAGMIAAAGPAAGGSSTYYVRADGGSAEHCDGRRDVAYSGSGRHRSCAWRHPFDALPPGGAARIKGGDTLVIGSGSYLMGMGAPGSDKLEKCRKDWPWDCHVAAIPAGPSSDRRTRILGAGFDQGCRKPPELWGAQHASVLLDLTGSSNVEVACLELTDHSSCIEFHNASQLDRCERDKAPYGDWASSGIAAADSSNVRLTDLNIHGLAHDGIRAGRLRDWTLERVRIVGNGWSGWSGDIGGNGSGNEGQLVFRNVEIAWNGCGEKYPGGQRFGCWGQETGGYGDGLGTGETAGDWLFDHVNVHHNSQDGIDLLHANASARIAFRNVHAEANAGNQIKAGGTVTIADSVVLGTCGALGGRTGLDAGDRCRAAGNSISLQLPANAHDAISNSVIEGEGDCLVGLECAGDGCTSASATLDHNRLRGALRKDVKGATKLPCSVWVEPPLHGAKLEFTRNTLHATRALSCPDGITACSDNRTQ